MNRTNTEQLFSEVFADFAKAETKEAKITVLHRNDHPRLRDFLRAVFHPNIIFDVIVPTYKPAPEPAGLNFTYIESEMPKVYRFVKGHPARAPELKTEKQTALLKVILESLHKDDADLFVKMIQKDLQIPSLTKKIVKEAFPDLDLG